MAGLTADVNRRNFSAARPGPPQQRQLKTEILKFKVSTITKQPLPQVGQFTIYNLQFGIWNLQVSANTGRQPAWGDSSFDSAQDR